MQKKKKNTIKKTAIVDNHKHEAQSQGYNL